ncbi:hypothetical protein GBF38_003402 [Nibea albiflora]|uniref:Uncharacterized protein n=1 Tax=Nibea albiflora TaxID=240163 RepID=A0ACB7FLR2_NIBAL|nr:hypothetical protein GBF38_003402 [Nibea albiflora]
MRACLVLLCLLAATFALSVKSKPHGKHRGLHKTSHTAKEKDIVTEEANKPQILPTLVPLEVSSLEQDDEELSSDDHANASKEDFEVTEGSDKSPAVLLSEEELVDLLKKEAEEEQEAEEIVLEEESQDREKRGESGEIIEDEVEEKTSDDKLETEEEEEKEESVEDADMLQKEEVEVEKIADKEEQGALLEETGVDLDYAADSGILSPLQLVSPEKNPHTDDTQPDVKEKETSEKGLQTIPDDYEQNVQNTEAVDSEEVSDQDQTRVAGKEEEKSKNDSGSQPKRKTRKQKKNQRARKHSPQSEETQTGQEQSQQDPQESEGSSTDNTVQKAKRRRAGKWVCGTDNKTYDTACELFATKCNLEGTKRGHRLHLDYTGSCKLIPACEDTELVQFPLRMRDWLKNVLLQLYEHDSVSSGFLTPKQRFRVKKIFESERRLHSGDHSVELLAQDFEKNYNMYIYPVHWQFAQLDQHPADRFLTHSELAPLRVPLVPMEHCTSRFFQECDADKDKLVSFKEWTSCFGIKNGKSNRNTNIILCKHRCNARYMQV